MQITSVKCRDDIIYATTSLAMRHMMKNIRHIAKMMSGY